MEISLFNLISNAIKYTPGGGSVSLTIRQRGPNVLIEVCDTGCGIPQHSGERIFDVFHRDYESNSRHKGGFGIGLHLVKKFAEAHRASLTYSDNFPRGTCFTLSMQCGEAHLSEHLVFEDVAEKALYMDEILKEIEEGSCIDARADTHVVVEIPEIEELIDDQKTMLIVDDNAEIRHYLHRMFQHEFRLYEAESAEAALRYLEHIEPDIVLSDIVMETTSGIELCAAIKENPELNHIPVILLTASSSSEVRLKGLDSGADDYVTKPFDRDILLARVRNLIQMRSKLHNYFYKEITLQKSNLKIAPKWKEFIEKTIAIVEQNLENQAFCVKMLAEVTGMSHSNLYKRIKSISGKTATEFIRFVRLRRAARLLIETDHNVNEAAFAAGFGDLKYFREQFTKLFGMSPSRYRKKYRTVNSQHRLVVMP